MVVDIAPGAGLVVALWGFCQRVAVGNHPVLGPPPLRTPAADRQAQRQPHIQGRPVYAGLAAADDLLKHRSDPAPTYSRWFPNIARPTRLHCIKARVSGDGSSLGNAASRRSNRNHLGLSVGSHPSSISSSPSSGKSTAIACLPIAFSISSNRFFLRVW